MEKNPDQGFPDEDVKMDHTPMVQLPVAVLHNITVAVAFALRNGAYNSLSVLEMHELTGNILSAQHYIPK